MRARQRGIPSHTFSQFLQNNEWVCMSPDSRICRLGNIHSKQEAIIIIVNMESRGIRKYPTKQQRLQTYIATDVDT